jgi:hypothetical protein
VNSEVNDFDLLVEQIRKYTKIKNTWHLRWLNIWGAWKIKELHKVKV